jgi:hypothetical protein
MEYRKGAGEKDFYVCVLFMQAVMFLCRFRDSILLISIPASIRVSLLWRLLIFGTLTAVLDRNFYLYVILVHLGSLIDR